MRKIELECIRDREGSILTYMIGGDPDGSVLAYYQDYFPGSYISEAFVETELTNEQLKTNMWNALKEPLD